MRSRERKHQGLEVLISAAGKSCFGHADVKFWHRFRESKRPQVGTEQTLLQRQHFWLPAASLRDEAIAPNGIPFLGCAGEVEGEKRPYYGVLYNKDLGAYSTIYRVPYTRGPYFQKLPCGGRSCKMHKLESHGRREWQR